MSMSDSTENPPLTRRQKRAERLRREALSPRRILSLILILPGVMMIVALSVYLRTSPYYPTDAMMHLLARGGCDMARRIGLAGARRGEIGYHARNDHDGNGVACEIPGARMSLQEPLIGNAGDGRSDTGAKFIRP